MSDPTKSLPDKQFLRLTDALSFALYGTVAAGGPRGKVYLPAADSAIHDTVSDPWDGSVIEIAAGGLLHGLDADAAREVEREFHEKLEVAATKGVVRFFGERRGGAFTTEWASERTGATPIPPQFFGSPVEFSIETGRIDIDPEGLDDDERTIFERVALTDYQGEGRDFRGWGAVAVERDSFLAWLERWRDPLGTKVSSVEQPAAKTAIPMDGGHEKDKGGAPRRADFDLFVRKVVRHAHENGIEETLTEFRKLMKQWAVDELRAEISDKTVERWIDIAVPRDIFPK
jgi:hypothetical protein